jgi:hypothetical protein
MDYYFISVNSSIQVCHPYRPQDKVSSNVRLKVLERNKLLTNWFSKRLFQERFGADDIKKFTPSLGIPYLGV